ncbi:MAG: zf-TFIIB domain-containing protein [Deltaproteobacteria bacterium]|nr:zf-TFIIB domain-containing protein [Deltaproteobacteria bacterium]
MVLECPRCKRPLAAADLGGTTVDACAGCGGTWLDRGELEAVAARPAAASETAASPFVETAVKYLPCPRCRQLMTRRQYERFSGVVLDYCGAHGVWADRGEIERVQAFLQAGGVERRARREEEERKLARSVERYGTDRGAGADTSHGWVDVALWVW